jgi:hypothetical protein
MRDLSYSALVGGAGLAAALIVIAWHVLLGVVCAHFSC